MAVLNKFLCCYQLGTGALIIAWAGLIVDVISFGVTSAVLAQPICLSIGILEYKAPAAFILTCTIISSFVNVALLWAIKDKNKLFLFLWLTVKMVFLVFIFLAFFILGINKVLSGADKGVVAGIFTSGFLVTGILLYLWVCILSFLQELWDEPLNKENRPMEHCVD